MNSESRYASVNGIQMHYEVHGEGPPVVLLHGFPDTRRSFDAQLEALCAAGFSCVTPDLRGYGKTDRPFRGYDLNTLGRDVAELLDHLGAPVHLVGHDWGGGIAWNVATAFPDRVRNVVILNAPHPVLMGRALLTNRRQIRRSWYFFFFQLNGVAERWLTKNGGKNIARMFREGSPGQFEAPPEIVEAAREALCEPEAATSAIAYYRAAVRGGLHPRARRELESSYGQVTAPVTIIWGTEDSCLGIELLDGVEDYANDLSIHRVPGAGHFVHQERPGQVNPLLLSALGTAA